MISCDTNVLFAATNPDDACHAAAFDFVACHASEFYTRNVRDFVDVGFAKLENPLGDRNV